jgi:hypothetical protein
MRPLLKGGAAEEVVDTPRGEDEVVVGQRAAVGLDSPAREIDAGDAPEAEVRVGLAVEDGAGRERDLTGIEQGRCHLVEERVEEVVVVLIDKENVDRGLPQPPDSSKAPETGSHNHDTGTSLRRCRVPGSSSSAAHQPQASGREPTTTGCRLSI